MKFAVPFDKSEFLMSLPAWECGLKYNLCDNSASFVPVTPCVGVWIEMITHLMTYSQLRVTPCVGVWIEITWLKTISQTSASHSLRGSVD